jgi:HlyD family secretion protein
MPLSPQSAVHDDGGKKVVFLVKDDRLERRAVTLGGTRGSDTEVVAGLMIGDTVVVNGPADLHDGQTVAIKR